jgi:FkbH-like protein
VQELENLWFVDPNPVVDGLGRTGLQDDVLVGSTHAGFIGDFGFKRDIARLVPPTRPREVFGVDDRVTRYGEAMWDELTMLVDVINSPQQVKLIIVDLDDTLWRGTAAEDDFDLNERRSGWPFGMVEALLIYKRRGGLLAICSKNSRADTLVRFDEIWGQLLDLDDFASIHISWDPKPEGIARILADVNVLPANTLFFDDNPRELAEVKARFPTINLCGENHYLWRSQILFAAETQVARVTGEGVARTSLVQGRVKREASKKELSRDDWLRSLELSLTVQRVTSTVDKAYTRAFELLNKTNQFNTTGKRWSETELADLFAQSGYLVTASLSDCFVDNGLVGVTVVRGETIEQAVLSCRVFGLEAEIGMLKVVCDGVLDRHSRVVGKLVTTDSNLVCRNIYQLLGFTQHDEGYVTSESPAFPEWMRLVEPATESSGRD